MKYYAFFSIILLSSPLVVAKQENYQPEYKLVQSQEQDNLNALIIADQPDKVSEQADMKDTSGISGIDVKLPRNEAVQGLIKAMKELWGAVNYEPDETLENLLNEQAESYSSLAMEHALEVSFNLLEEHGEHISKDIHAAFTRSLSKLVLLSDDFDSDIDGDFACEETMRCSCGEQAPDSISQAYFNS